MMWNTGLSGGMWGGWIGMLLVVLFGTLILVGFVLIVVWAIRASSPGGQQQHTPHPPTAGSTTDPAEQAARERFARGEISKDELDDIVRVLRGG